MDSDKEFLEAQIDFKRTCTIQFRDVSGALSTIRAHIIKMDTVSERDMIETDAGLVIGMDQLVAVNDRPMGNYC